MASSHSLYHDLASMTWTEVRELPPSQCMALLPVGAMEAHGPHLPLTTDVIIAQGMARNAATRLGKQGQRCVLLEPLVYTTAPFARAFPGTISLRESTAKALLTDIATQVLDQGFAKLVICNAHLDPSHIRVLRAFEAEFAPRVLFPDVTRRVYAAQLGEEFQSGACHAGQYESSMVLARKPSWVRTASMRSLPDNPRSLVEAMRAGKDDFVESGGPEAYFGSPAKASAQEGRARIAQLGDIVLQALAAGRAEDERAL